MGAKGGEGPLGRKADTRLSGRASEFQGGQMASREKRMRWRGRVDGGTEWASVCGRGGLLMNLEL